MKFAAGLHVELVHLLATGRAIQGGFKRSLVFDRGAYRTLLRECQEVDHVVRSHLPHFKWFVHALSP